MKKIFIIFFLVSLQACQKNFREHSNSLNELRSEEQLLQQEIQAPYKIIIPTLVYNVDGWTTGYGLWMTQSRRVELNPVTGRWELLYWCPLKNDAVQAANGVNDFWLKKSDYPGGGSGEAYLSGFIETSVFRVVNGLLINDDSLQKNEFNYSITDVVNGYNWSLHRYYGADTMAIQAQAFDRYFAKTRITSLVADYCVKVEVDPNKILSANYVAVLPVNINETVVTTDESLLTATPMPASELMSVFSQGRHHLNWHCPYHNPYIRHENILKLFYKNGTTQTVSLNESRYDAKGNVIRYEVSVSIPGFNISETRSYTINK